MNCHKIYLFILFVSFQVLACNSTKVIKPLEKYTSFKYSVKSSTVNVPISVDIDSLKALIDKEIPEVLYEDTSMTNNNNDKLMVTAKRAKAIKFEIIDQKISYSVPLSLWIKKDVGITKLEGEGELTLDFETKFTVSENWKLVTKTDVVNHHWERKPVVKFGLFDLPIKFIGDQMVAKSKSTLEQLIDTQLSEKFQLQQLVHNIWERLKSPILVSEENQAWLQIAPEHISMAPFETDERFINTHINIIAKNEVVLGEEPPVKDALPLPVFAFKENKNEGFEINMMTSISYSEAAKMANEIIAGQTFSSGNRTVKVEEVKLFGRENKLFIDARITGDFNGNLYLEGLPVFNESKNEIELDNVDFEIQTKNFLHKSAAWLFKKGLKKQIEDSARFPIGENISTIKKAIRDKLENYQLTEGVLVKGNLKKFEIQGTYLTPDSIVLLIQSFGQLQLEVEGLN